MMEATASDADLAASLAERAGRLLRDLRRAGNLSGEALGAVGDRDANRLILEALRAARPEDGILSEEAADDLTRLSRRRVWIIDPLDGTREYAAGLDDWAVHVGLAIDGEPVLGAVAIPERGLVFRSDRIDPPPAMRGKRLALVSSRSRGCPEADALAEYLGADTVPMGSAGVKAMAVVTGQADLYVHAGGQSEWDNCAPAAVALAAGLHVSRLDGRPIRYNQAVAAVPDLVIARTELVGNITGWFEDWGSTNARK